MMSGSTDAHDWHDGRHEATVEEWVFTAWTADASVGIVSGHRIVGRTAWYWASLARVGRPLLHVADFDVPVRVDPFIVKGEALWAEHHCDAELEQWSVGNETYASAITDPDDALGRAYGVPTPIAFDLEWYATGPVSVFGVGAGVDGYGQPGVVHGAVEILGEPRLELVEVPAHRWHRWSADGLPDPVDLPTVAAHTGVRAPFAFPDGTVDDLVLTAGGWARRLTGRVSRPD
jgi:hypothetical protein